MSLNKNHGITKVIFAMLVIFVLNGCDSSEMPAMSWKKMPLQESGMHGIVMGMTYSDIIDKIGIPDRSIRGHGDGKSYVGFSYSEENGPNRGLVFMFVQENNQRIEETKVVIMKAEDKYENEYRGVAFIGSDTANVISIYGRPDYVTRGSNITYEYCDKEKVRYFIFPDYKNYELDLIFYADKSIIDEGESKCEI